MWDATAKQVMRCFLIPRAVTVLAGGTAEPDARAFELAAELAEGPQVAMRLLKRSMYNAAELTFAQACEDIAARTAIVDHHPDAREGVAAWREKRAPRFNQKPA